MKLEQQVVSLELAQKLKELGVKQESYFMWNNFDREEWLIDLESKLREMSLTPRVGAIIGDFASAFTVAELGEMLPKNVQFPTPQREGKGWCWRNEEGNHFVDTEADARAKMLVYLLENGLIK